MRPRCLCGAFLSRKRNCRLCTGTVVCVVCRKCGRRYDMLEMEAK